MEDSEGDVVSVWKEHEHETNRAGFESEWGSDFCMMKFDCDAQPDSRSSLIYLYTCIYIYIYFFLYYI